MLEVGRKRGITAASAMLNRWPFDSPLFWLFCGVITLAPLGQFFEQKVGQF